MIVTARGASPLMQVTNDGRAPFVGAPQAMHPRRLGRGPSPSCPLIVYRRDGRKEVAIVTGTHPFENNS